MVKRALIFIDRFHWLWLAIAAPFLLFSSPERSILMLVIPALFMIHWLASKVKIDSDPGDTHRIRNEQQSVLPSTPFNGVLLLMMIMVLVSLWATFDIVYSLPKITGIILGVGIFYVIAREGQTPRGWWLSFLLLISLGFGISVIGLLGTHWNNKITFLTPIISRLSSRIIGLPGAEEGFHPNYVAGALLWVIPGLLTFCWMLLTKAKELRALIGRGRFTIVIMLVIGAILWTTAIFILTQSRGGYISLALTLPLLLLIALPPRFRRNSLLILLLLALILGVLVSSRWESVRVWITGSNLASDLALSLDSLEGRMEVWSRAIYGIQDFPFTGMGMNAFRKVVPVLYSLFSIGPGIDIGHAHNEFLQAALDLGIPGLIAFIGLNIIAFWLLVQTWKSVGVNSQAGVRGHHNINSNIKRGGWFIFSEASLLTEARLVQLAVLGLGGGLLAHMLWGLTDAMALGARPAFLFWMLLGLVSGLYQQTHMNTDKSDIEVSISGVKNGSSK
jgi:putative inorganic carbon (HCO3(-)) transporter